MKHLLLLIFTISFSIGNSQTISGTVTDKADNSLLFGVTVVIKGTSMGAVTNDDGKFQIENIPAGTYNIEVSSLGYETALFTSIKIIQGENKTLDVVLSATALTIDQDVIIYGDKPLIDVEDSHSGSQIKSDIIESAPTRKLQDVLNTQTGVVQNPEGIHIRGGRTYETGFYIDDVSASDPLAGTGFGIDIGTNSIESIDVSTSSSDVEYGDATSGVVNTKTKSGGNNFSMDAAIKKDNLAFNSKWASVFNQNTFELGMGGPLKLKKTSTTKLKYYTSFKTNFTDTYIKRPANQVVSSLYPNLSWSPFEDNRWSGLLKLNYDFSTTKKLSFSYMKSITINQDFNMLRVTGNDVGFTPGYQWVFALQPDNANTYTHDTNLESLSWINTPKPSFSYRISASRLFVHLRADANGRPWRPEVVNSEFDPSSIVSFPTSYFNPDDSVTFVFPGPGLYNNNGIATLWHDHFVLENTIKTSGSWYSKNTLNKFYAGAEFKFQEMQWIDIVRPWIGAPIPLPDGQMTQSFRLGDLSDVWHVKPFHGALYASDKFKFRGLITDIGLRFEYWMPGKFVDDEIKNPASPINDQIRQNYLASTYNLFGRRTKMRLLPKISASFPIKENQVMYFNYGHSTVSPHPSYLYTGLDPFYADRSTLGRIGNPDLNPEVDISYELGLKSQISSNDAFTLAAFWKDKYDFITSSTILIKDVTGHDVSRTIHINSDYARIRGLETTYTKRIKKWFTGQLSLSYSVATGQSSSASQTLSEILTTGNTTSSKELPLAWDSPIDAKSFALINVNQSQGLWGHKALNHFSLYTEAVYRSGRRYTPYLFQGNEASSGRPIYEVDSDPDHAYSEISTPGFWLNTSFKKWWKINDHTISFSIDVTNVLNNLNTAIANPVTGTAYSYGDPVPSEWRDPVYLDPRDYRSNNIPPDNPARYYELRHILFGLSLSF